MTYPKGNSRITSYNKEWLYLNLMATGNCSIRIKVTFKNDASSYKPRHSTHQESNIDEMLEQSMLMGSTSKGDDNKDFNFSNFTLGNGKLQDKRKILLGYLEQLTNNKKMHDAHRRYCDDVKRKRQQGQHLGANTSKMVKAPMIPPATAQSSIMGAT